MRYVERGGWLALLLPAAVVGAASGVTEAAAAQPETTVREYDTTFYHVRETTKRQRTPEEEARMRENARRMGGVHRAPGHAEVDVFFRHADRTASGVAATLYPTSIASDFVSIDLGFHLVRLSDTNGPVDAPAMGPVARDGRRDFRSLGTTLRAGFMAPRNLAELELEAVINLAYWGDDDDPRTPVQERRGSLLRAALSVNPVERVMVRGSAMTRTRFDDLGWSIEAGVRF